jgi:hypothetical protein
VADIILGATGRSSNSLNINPVLFAYWRVGFECSILFYDIANLIMVKVIQSDSLRQSTEIIAGDEFAS